MSCGQCEVSKRLAYRHILKSIVNKLEEKNQKFSFSKRDLSLSVHMQSAMLLPLSMQTTTQKSGGIICLQFPQTDQLNLWLQHPLLTGLIMMVVFGE